jgi:hypothetical protein
MPDLFRHWYSSRTARPAVDLTLVGRSAAEALVGDAGDDELFFASSQTTTPKVTTRTMTSIISNPAAPFPVRPASLRSKRDIFRFPRLLSITLIFATNVAVHRVFSCKRQLIPRMEQEEASAVGATANAAESSWPVRLDAHQSSSNHDIYIKLCTPQETRRGQTTAPSCDVPPAALP